MLMSVSVDTMCPAVVVEVIPDVPVYQSAIWREKEKKMFNQLFGTPESTTTLPPAPAAIQPPAQDLFSAIGSAVPGYGSVYPIPGLYPLLYIDVIKLIKTRKQENMFIAEFDILASEVAARQSGTRMSWLVNMRHDASPGNVRGFLAAVACVPVEKITGDLAKIMCGQENPCHGRLVKLEASQIMTKAGTPFTLCRWSSIPEEIQPQAEEFRNKAGFDNVPF